MPFEDGIYSKADIQNKVSAGMMRMAKGKSNLQDAVWLLHDAYWMLKNKMAPKEPLGDLTRFGQFRAVGDNNSLSPVKERLTKAIGIIETGHWADAAALLQDALRFVGLYAKAKGVDVKMQPTPALVESETSALKRAEAVKERFGR